MVGIGRRNGLTALICVVVFDAVRTTHDHISAGRLPKTVVLLFAGKRVKKRIALENEVRTRLCARLCAGVVLTVEGSAVLKDGGSRVDIKTAVCIGRCVNDRAVVHAESHARMTDRNAF